MPGFLGTFRSRNLLFCVELYLSPAKGPSFAGDLLCIDAALNQTARDSFPLTELFNKNYFRKKTETENLIFAENLILLPL